MENKDKIKVQYSKILPCITLIVFIGCLICGFTADFTTMVDVSFYVTSATISGTAFVTSIVFYYRKAQAENSIKLKTSLYETSCEMRLKYNAEMMKLQHQFNMTNDEVRDMEEGSVMDEFEQEALDSVKYSIDMVQEDADTMIEMPNF